MRKYAIELIPIVVISLGLFVVWVAISKSNDVGKENNGYVRVINCIVSKNAVDRTQADIELCYATVERDLDISLKRYDR